jgi:hypothetical protein
MRWDRGIIKMRRGSRDGLYDLVRFLETQYTEIRMVEIGCYQGESTEIFCSSNLVKHVYTVDPYKSDYDSNDKASSTNMELVEQRFVERTTKHLNKITKLKLSSLEALEVVSDINFVYIDACHQYECVLNDLIGWKTKLKEGDYIGGHDYPRKRKRGPVFEAVNDFCKINGLNVSKQFKDSSFLIRI